MITTTRSTFPMLLLRCFIVLASFFASHAWAQTVLFEATYKGKIAGLSIHTERKLMQLDDGSYLLESKASNFMGSLTERSHFTKTGDLWRPVKYSYKRRILGAKATETIEFDWRALTARYTHSDKKEQNQEHRLVPGVLDPALYQLRMQRDLVLGVESLDYQFAKRGKIHHYVIEQHRTEELQVSNKHFQSIKMGRADTRDDKQTYVWAIPELQYMFGKIVHIEDDGDVHQMMLTRYRVDRDSLRQFFSESQMAQTGNDTATR